MDYTDADRERAIAILRKVEHVSTRLETVERQQRRTLRYQRAVAPTVAKAIVGAVSKRAALLLAAGMMLGSALGGAAMELARKLVVTALAGH